MARGRSSQVLNTAVNLRRSGSELYIDYTWNDNFVAIFEVKLKAASDNQKPQKLPIFKCCF